MKKNHLCVLIFVISYFLTLSCNDKQDMIKLRNTLQDSLHRIKAQQINESDAKDTVGAAERTRQTIRLKWTIDSLETLLKK
jgi:hypothetical protein